MNAVRQLPRAWAVCKKDIRIYYLKGPVLIFGPLLPVFLFLAFYIGRDLAVGFLIPGLIAMTLFFTTTAVGPVIAPWETRMRVLERLIAAPVSLAAILLGDALASCLFGLAVAIVPLSIGLGLGVPISHPGILAGGLILGACCFAYIGLLFSAPPADVPGNVMMLSALFKFPLVFISGIFLPLEQLPGWGRGLAYVSPLTYLTDLLRYATGSGHHLFVALDLGAMIAFTGLAAGTAYALHRRSMPRRFG